jgi:hypothetical protein
MHWNHRVIEKKLSYEADGDIVTESYFELVEVYYDEETNKPMARCEPHITGDTIEELQQTVARFEEALKQPVLTEADFPNLSFEEDED